MSTFMTGEVERLGDAVDRLHATLRERDAEIERLRALKLPATQQIYNLMKVMYEDAEAKVKQLREVLVAVRPFINAWGSQTDLDQIDAALADDKEPGR